MFESDKFVLTKSGQFIEKWYLDKGLFNMNALIVHRTIESNKVMPSTYLLECSNL